jgi:hypothetical protein
MVLGTLDFAIIWAADSVVGFSDLGDVRAAKTSLAPTHELYRRPRLRVDTPLGLVRADVGFRLNRMDAYPRENRFAFYVGLGAF